MEAMADKELCGKGGEGASNGSTITAAVVLRAVTVTPRAAERDGIDILLIWAAASLADTTEGMVTATSTVMLPAATVMRTLAAATPERLDARLVTRKCSSKLSTVPARVRAKVRTGLYSAPGARGGRYGAAEGRGDAGGKKGGDG